MKISDLKTYNVVATPPPPTAAAQPQEGIAQKVSNFIGAKGLTDLAGSQIAKFGLAAQGNMDAANRVEQPSFQNVIGSAIQTGANFIPGAGIGAGIGRKVATGALTGYAMDVGSKLQNNQASPFNPGAGTAVGAALPVGGAGIAFSGRVMSRLLKGLASGASGVSTKTIEDLINNPEVAQKATDKLQKTGNFRVIEDNAKTLVNGVSKIQKEASNAYGSGLEALTPADINPEKLKEPFFKALAKNKITVGENGVDFSTSDFLNPKVQEKAQTVLDKINSHKDFSGSGIKKLMDFVDGSKFKTTGGDAEREAFNAFAVDMKNALKEGVSASTNKLDEINKKYSSDIQLSEAAQKIFGKVNYKNMSEVAKAAKSLESLFNQKGLDPETIDKFLTRIGVNPTDFRTGEAVRQITNKEPMAPNSPGFSMGEVVRSITGSILTPETVRDVSIKTGLAKEKLAPLLKGVENLPSALQKAVIQALLQNQ